jgi:hypothetical protein
MGEGWLRLEAAGDRPIAEEVEARLRSRLESGAVTAAEIERLRGAALRTFADGASSEAFRQCCIAWDVERPAPITSHRPIVGPFIVAAKKLVRRALHFQNQAFLARQREFNWNLLLVLRDLLDRDRRGRE